MRYEFYADKHGVPIKLWMLGINLLTGGHKDEYIMDYYDYKVGWVPVILTIDSLNWLGQERPGSLRKPNS